MGSSVIPYRPQLSLQRGASRSRPSRGTERGRHARKLIAAFLSTSGRIAARLGGSRG